MFVGLYKHMRTFETWREDQTVFNEAGESRYSVEINFRTTMEEVLHHAAKVTLGYVSAALKKSDFHVKQVFEEKPLRIMVSNRNWDDGEWVCLVSWNPNKKCYIVSKGYYNKDRKTVSIQDSKDCKAGNAAEITKEVKNYMHDLKDKPDRHVTQLKRVPLKRGPK